MKKNSKIARSDNFSFELETRKNLGQNFLADQTILAQIIARAQTHAKTSAQVCLEIGPGSGALTRKLLEAGWTVHAVEKDQRAVQGLKNSLGVEFPDRFRVIEADILRFDASELLATLTSAPLCIGNIPYYITSDILFWFLKHDKRFSAGIFMVQKEVGDRLACPPGHKDYGRLSVRIQLACAVEQVLVAPARAFVPPPKVDSAVMELLPRTEALLSSEETEPFEKFTALLFSARRKMLRKTLQQASHELFGRGIGEEAFARFAENAQKTLSVELTQRPEELAPVVLLNLYRMLRGAL
ncbi:MAG: ribosomal RNA small subunit methyltransferase A [Betaproteobacteria bacterium]|nr:ribosomal RNA small subunit methyltransferase A [Betaproteobacteria bacterium]